MNNTNETKLQIVLPLSASQIILSDIRSGYLEEMFEDSVPADVWIKFETAAIANGFDAKDCLINKQNIIPAIMSVIHSFWEHVESYEQQAYKVSAFKLQIQFKSNLAKTEINYDILTNTIHREIRIVKTNLTTDIEPELLETTTNYPIHNIPLFLSAVRTGEILNGFPADEVHQLEEELEKNPNLTGENLPELSTSKLLLQLFQLNIKPTLFYESLEPVASAELTGDETQADTKTYKKVSVSSESWLKSHLVKNKVSLKYKKNPPEPLPTRVNTTDKYLQFFASINTSEFINFHINLINCAKKLGYSAPENGVCHGFTMRWIEALLTDTSDLFLRRTEKILKLRNLLNSGIALEEQKILSQEELWDIKAFYESLLIYQDSSINFKILTAPHPKDKLEKISAIASSDTMIRAGGYKETRPIYFGNFNAAEVKSLLESLEKKIHDSGYQKPISFLFSLLSDKENMHNASMTFHPNHNTWQYIDINFFPPYPASSISELIKLLPTQFYQNFSLRVILPKMGDDVTELENQIQKISLLTTDLSHAKYLHYLAAIEGDLRVIKELLDIEMDLNLRINNGATSLYMAAQNGHLEIVEVLLANEKVDPNLAMNNGATPLYIAAQNGHLEIVEALLANQKVDPNLAKNSGETPLYIAAQNGYFEVVHNLLGNQKVDPNLASNHGATALFMAVQKGHLEMVEVLLANEKTNPNSAIKNGATPLYIAAQNGHLKVIQALLKNQKTNPNLAMNDGIAPLHIAVHKRQLEIVQALLANEKVDPNLARNLDTTPLFIAAENGHLEIVKALLSNEKTNPNLASNLGSTPLFMAAENGHLEVVQALLKHEKVDPNLASNLGSTPLFMAAENGHLEVVKALLGNQKTDPNLAMKNGATPLFIAVQNRHLKVIQELLDNEKIAPNLAMRNGATPLFIAVQNRYLKVLQELLGNQKIDPNLALNNGLSPLFVAAQKGHLEEIQALLNNEKVDPNLASNEGATPLFMAAQNGHLEIVKTLLANEKTNPNLAIKNGATPLYIAAQNGHLKVIQALLAHEKTDPNIATNNGITPLSIASNKGYFEIVNLIMAHQASNSSETPLCDTSQTRRP